MASTEERAYEIMRELDVSYVLVIFGGLTGYSSDGKSPPFSLAEVEKSLGVFFLFFFRFVNVYCICLMAIPLNRRYQ